MVFFEKVKTFFKNVLKKMTPGIWLIIVVVVSLVSLFFQYFRRDNSLSVAEIAGAVIVPFQKGVNEIGSFLFKSEQDRISLNEARDRINELEDENGALQRKIDELNALDAENRELRELLQAKERLGDFEVKEATIIGNDGINVFSRFTINLGSADGVKTNMNVVNGDGLVGIVTFVGFNYAIVTSIVEEGLSVSAMTKNGHENMVVTGALKSAGNSTLKLENAAASIDFSTDSTVVTSNISDKFLPNLLIGYAENMTENSDGLTQSGIVKSAVDFTRLKEVLVIMTLKEELREKAP